MKKILKKTEKFFTTLAILADIVYPGRGLNVPKQKEYFGRIILSIFGILVFFFLLILLYSVFFNS